MKIKMWIVMYRGEPYAAYPKLSSAKVYATNFSDSENVSIIEGHFIDWQDKKEAINP